MATPEIPVGAKVQVSSGIGYVRWTGANPKFATGNWVGVELSSGVGKNDGSVQGERYFDCRPKHGVFVRPSQVQIIEAPKTTRPVGSKHASTASVSRLASSTASTVARPNAKAGPSTPPRATKPASSTPPRAGIKSTTASPSKLGSRQVSTSSITTAPRPPSVASTTGRPPSTIPQPLSRAQTPLDRGLSAASPIPASPSLTESSLPDVGHRPGPSRFPSTASAASQAMPPPPVPFRATSPTKRAQTPSGVEESSIAVFAQKREVDELRIKVRLLEGRRAEDQEKIKVMEAKAAEADTLRAARVKLQAKFQELQTSVAAAQRTAKDLQSENTHMETRAADANDQLEMAALDREVAEERAEAAEAELEKLNDKVQELELEVAILKEENAEYEKPVDGLDGERSSLAYIQLEKHNERLKEALIRLRDLSSDNEKESKSKISDLEKELSILGDAQSRLELSEAKLANAETQVEDLKLQLDDALGAEDLLEQLTERNLQMSERIEEMRQTIEDLEALKDLNDELEENHVESEKQLTREIDILTVRLRDERQRSADLDALVIDTEATLSQFRDLVTNLQSEVESLRLLQASQQVDTAATSKEAQNIMNLNLKLQSTAAKMQNKAIDVELQKLEAAQLSEHLRIVQAYLPDPYAETEADSTSLYLTLLRLSSKTDIITSTISQSHSIPTSLHADNPASSPLVGICELRGKLRDFSNLNKRFAAILKRCGADDWISFGKVLGELGGVESRVDGWIGMVRNDDFNEKDCARELASLTAQFAHLGSTVFDKPELDIPEQQLALAYTIDYDLDNFAAAVGFARQSVDSLTQEPEIEVVVGDSSLEAGVYEPVQRILDQVRTVKVSSSKLVAQMEEVWQISSALLPEVTVALADLSTSVSSAVDLAVQLAQRIGAHAASIRSSKNPLRLSDIEGFLVEITSQSAAPAGMPPWDQIGMFITRLGQELGMALPKIKQAVKDGQVVHLDIPPPWLARVASIKEAASHNVDTERKVVRMSEELKDLLREVKIRTLQESGVKVEILERRLEATRKQADTIIELENDLTKAKKQEKVYSDAIEQLQAEQDALEAENARLRKGVDPAREALLPAVELALPMGGGLEASQLAEQVENLRSAIRYLRSENSLLKSRHLYPDLKLLAPIPSFPIFKSTDKPNDEAEGEVPGLSPTNSSSSDTSPPSTPITPTRQSLETESKILIRDITNFQIKPRIVDISNIDSRRGWKSRKGSPESQVLGWKREEEKLGRRVEGLKERMRGLSRK